MQWIDSWLQKDEAEALEDPSLPAEKRFAIVEELHRIERRLGFHALIARQLEPLVALAARRNRGAPVKILDIGVGSGGVLEEIWKNGVRKNIPLELHGLDADPAFARMTQERLAGFGINAKLFHANEETLPAVPEKSFDIVCSTNVVHHIRDPKSVVSFLRECARLASQGLLIVDIHRSPLGLLWMYGAGLVGATKILVEDGKKSVRRAYRTSEINALCSDAGLPLHCERIPFYTLWRIRKSFIDDEKMEK